MTAIGEQQWTTLKRRIELPGGRQFAYVDRGEGPALLLLHGYSDSSRSFSLIAPFLAGYRLIIPDLAGHGGSRAGPGLTVADLAGDIDCLAARLGLRDIAIVGHSMGAMIAIALAARRPDLIGALGLLSGSLQPSLGEGNPTARAIRALKDPLRPDHPFFDTWHACSRPVDAAFLAQLRREAAEIPIRVWHAILDDLAAIDLNSDARQLRVPVLAISGSEDPLFDAGHRQQLAAMLASIRSITLEGHGHNPHWESPGLVAEHVLSFLSAAFGPPGSTETLSAAHHQR
ncbi:alpha/beta hydrolase [Ensifer adhaerens]|uniref:alpha/beta fold hydrolase n=1 Tax=Ensifer adhaerens TaxID=106592 RepID=UPI001CBFEA68|nr:alpha/beta hydrolase [Ensifer adhaerens]MBZ7920800.1 alpha/beta hydrolase [Ensifer adhaerens]UAX93256.1 alpha/beta hydrolase [Ensifer adhaerens]UAY00893.1 alpha/beta hydrolase [Ensifer adhaerens]UAY08274.1 alpha/beta hydrolase [Ensifer adhaerens]